MRLDKFEYEFYKNGELIENEFTKRVVEFRTDIEHDLKCLNVFMLDSDIEKTAKIYMSMVHQLNKNENGPIFDTILIHSLDIMDRRLITFKYNIVKSLNMDIPHFDMNRYGRLFKPKLSLSFNECEIKLYEHKEK